MTQWLLHIVCKVNCFGFFVFADALAISCFCSHAPGVKSVTQSLKALQSCSIATLEYTSVRLVNGRLIHALHVSLILYVAGGVCLSASH